MHQQEKTRTENQPPVLFHFLPSGEIKIEGAVDEKQHAEIVTQIFEAAFSQRNLLKKQVDEVTKWNNIYQHFIIITILISSLFTISFVISRSITNSFKHSEARIQNVG